MFNECMGQEVDIEIISRSSWTAGLTLKNGRRKNVMGQHRTAGLTLVKMQVNAACPFVHPDGWARLQHRY